MQMAEISENFASILFAGHLLSNTLLAQTEHNRVEWHTFGESQMKNFAIMILHLTLISDYSSAVRAEQKEP